MQPRLCLDKNQVTCVLLCQGQREDSANVCITGCLLLLIAIVQPPLSVFSLLDNVSQHSVSTTHNMEDGVKAK